MEGDTVIVRLVRDRGQWFVEAAPRGADDWFSPVTWHDALVAPIAPSRSVPFEEQSALLLEDIAQIELACSANSAEIEKRLDAAREDRARARRELSSG